MRQGRLLSGTDRRLLESARADPRPRLERTAASSRRLAIGPVLVSLRAWRRSPRSSGTSCPSSWRPSGRPRFRPWFGTWATRTSTSRGRRRCARPPPRPGCGCRGRRPRCRLKRSGPVERGRSPRVDCCRRCKGRAVAARAHAAPARRSAGTFGAEAARRSAAGTNRRSPWRPSVAQLGDGLAADARAAAASLGQAGARGGRSGGIARVAATGRGRDGSLVAPRSAGADRRGAGIATGRARGYVRAGPRFRARGLKSLGRRATSATAKLIELLQDADEAGRLAAGEAVTAAGPLDDDSTIKLAEGLTSPDNVARAQAAEAARDGRRPRRTGRPAAR